MKAIGGAPSSRTAIAKRRKDPLKKYVSRAGVKDFGDRVRIDAYVYDEGNASKEAKKESKFQGKTGAGGRSRAPGGNAPAAPQ